MEPGSASRSRLAATAADQAGTQWALSLRLGAQVQAMLRATGRCVSVWRRRFEPVVLRPGARSADPVRESALQQAVAGRTGACRLAVAGAASPRGSRGITGTAACRSGQARRAP